MKQAIGGLLDGLPNDVDIVAANAPSPVDGINDFAKEHGSGTKGLRGPACCAACWQRQPWRSPAPMEIPVLVAKKDENGK